MVSNILLFVLIVGTTAVTWSNKLPKKPKEFANKTGCYIKEVNDVIPFKGSVNALGFCYLIHCSTKQIDYVSCGITHTEHETCIVTKADFDEPYPECCPQVQCFEDIPWISENKTARTQTNNTEKQINL